MASNHSLKVLCNKIFRKKVKVSTWEKFLSEIQDINRLPPYIVNTTEKGVGHFLAVVQTDKKNVLLFDPLASSLSELLMKPLIKTFHNAVYINHRKIQDDKSEYCGLFCLGFVHCYLQEKEEINSFFEMFHKDDLLKNDQIICDYLLSSIMNANKY